MTKVVILAGGFGTRLSEETELRPKPLTEIGGKPILWHIMKIYAAAGFEEFVICCGYKGSMIKSYFVNYFTENYDLTVNLGRNDLEFHGNPSENWRVTLVDTGIDTMTGGRLKRIRSYLNEETFCMTYGDGVADINPLEIFAFHKSHGNKATITAVPSPGRFGVLEMNDTSQVTAFVEKPHNEIGRINGGFFVLESSALDHVGGDDSVWEQKPLQALSKEGELQAFNHDKFWMPMDTLRDKRELERLWDSGNAPWKVW